MTDVHKGSEGSPNFSKERNALRSKRRKLLFSDYSIKKRQPFGLSRKRNNDVFVTNKTNFKAQLKICEKLLNNGAPEVIVHGLGAAVLRACNLALRLKEIHYGGIDLDIKTSTASIIDDFEPFCDNADYETISRNNSVKAMELMWSLNEVVDWLNLTIFEIWINLVSLTMFTMFLALKLDDNYFFGNTGWWIVFSPLFIADGLNTYFCAIVFMRMHMEGEIVSANIRALRSFTILLLLFVFKYFLCNKLTGQSTLQYTEIMSPIFVLWQLITLKACIRN